MPKLLVRGLTAPAEAEVVSTSEFETLAFDQISDISQNLVWSKDAEEILEGMSDMLELMKAVLEAKNIKTEHLFSTVKKLQAEEGTFHDKKAVEQEQ